MNKVKTCGNCVFLVMDEGEPFYCAIRDLYTFRASEDKACDEWLRKDGLKEGKPE